ncbi:MAG TPA: AraC family transcriptional regulator [Anaeromyxobacter sp.]
MPRLTPDRPSVRPWRGRRVPRAATPIAFVRALLLAYERYGVDPAEVLRQGQITPELLRSPTARITAGQMEAISEGAMRQLDDEALGWFGRRLPWGTLGMLCRASLPSPNLEVALKRWFRHHRLVADDIVLELSAAAGRATVSIVERRDLGAVREFCLVSYLRYVHGYACWAVDSRISLLEVGFPFPEPPHGDVYPILFPGPVSFGADRAHFTFDARYLSLPQRRDDRALREMLQHALPLTVLQYRRDRLLVQRVRRLLAEHPGDAHDAEDVARHLHLSTRSLHRHLREEGASLQALKDEIRRARAVDLLCRTERPVKQIAHAVGFADEKAFSRAFKAWTGETPREYRRRGGPV